MIIKFMVNISVDISSNFKFNNQLKLVRYKGKSRNFDFFDVLLFMALVVAMNGI